eukprot:c5607_g1_i2.p1 GENE.c5607_g1_i2~~c5607_g1_i2.p1  ORF type:complete len:239 (-),score=44.79 c5607_g1_i2:7-723(-)
MNQQNGLDEIGNGNFVLSVMMNGLQPLPDNKLNHHTVQSQVQAREPIKYQQSTPDFEQEASISQPLQLGNSPNDDSLPNDVRQSTDPSWFYYQNSHNIRAKPRSRHNDRDPTASLLQEEILDLENRLQQARAELKREIKLALSMEQPYGNVTTYSDGVHMMQVPMPHTQHTTDMLSMHLMGHEPGRAMSSRQPDFLLNTPSGINTNSLMMPRMTTSHEFTMLQSMIPDLRGRDGQDKT